LADNFPPGTGVPAAFLEFNGGVIAFRKSDALEKTIAEALTWAERLKEKRNQPPFRIALFHSDLRIAPLPQEYNCRIATYGYLTGTARILHGRLPGAPVPMRTEDFERAARVLNRVTAPRVFAAGAVHALVRNSRAGPERWTRTLVGRLYRPYVVSLRDALASVAKKFKRRQVSAPK
jgi:hypothetical protein